MALQHIPKIIASYYYGYDQHPLVKAAVKGRLTTADTKLLEKRDLKQGDQLIILFCATWRKQLHVLPSKYLTKRRLNLLGSDWGKFLGRRNVPADILKEAMKTGQIKYFSKEVLDIKYELWRGQSRESVLVAAILKKRFGYIKPERFTIESLRMTRRPNHRTSTTVLHYLARNGRLDIIPPGVVQPDHLKLTNQNDETPVHSAAKSHCLDQLSHLLNYHTLTKVSKTNAHTPVHILASHGEMDQIPEALRVPSIIFCPDRYGKTPYIYAKESRKLDQFPAHYLTREYMTRKHNNRTAFERMAARGLGKLLDNAPPGIIEPDDLPPLAQVALDRQNLSLGELKTWAKHFRKSSPQKLKAIKDRFPREMRAESDKLIDKLVYFIEGSKKVEKTLENMAKKIDHR